MTLEFNCWSCGAPMSAEKIGMYECSHCGAENAVPAGAGVQEALSTAGYGPYTKLHEVLDMAFKQASQGKGKERHATEGEPFERQIICEVCRRVGHGYTWGQAVKKIYEAERLPKDRAIAELLGAINYLAADIIVLMEKE